MSSDALAPRLLFVVNTLEFFLSHRLPIAVEAVDRGYDVHIVTGTPLDGSMSTDDRFSYHYCPLSRSGKNPVYELRTLLGLFRLYRRIRPHIVHLVTPDRSRGHAASLYRRARYGGELVVCGSRGPRSV